MRTLSLCHTTVSNNITQFLALSVLSSLSCWSASKCILLSESTPTPNTQMYRVTTKSYYLIKLTHPYSTSPSNSSTSWPKSLQVIKQSLTQMLTSAVSIFSKNTYKQPTRKPQHTIFLWTALRFMRTFKFLAILKVWSPICFVRTILLNKYSFREQVS